MAFLITGSSGFLAHHLIDELEPDVRKRSFALVRKRGSAPAGIQEIVSPFEFWTEAAAPICIGPVQGIFHLAAEVLHSRRNTDSMMRFNVESTLATVRLAALHGCRLIFVSSSGVVGASESACAAPREESEPSALAMRWPYYESKARAEREAKKLAKDLGVTLIIIRPPVLLGPRDPKLRALGLVRKFLQKKLPFALPGGMHFVDVRDVAEGLVRAMNHEQPAPIYHFPGTACTLVAFFHALSSAAGGSPPVPKTLPRVIALSLAITDSNLSRLVLRREHGFFPDPVVVEMGCCFWGLGGTWAKTDLGFLARPAEQTLSDTVNYLRSSGLIDSR